MGGFRYTLTYIYTHICNLQMYIYICIYVYMYVQVVFFRPSSGFSILSATVRPFFSSPGSPRKAEDPRNPKKRMVLSH